MNEPQCSNADHDTQAEELIKQGYVVALCEKCGEPLHLTMRILMRQWKHAKKHAD